MNKIGGSKKLKNEHLHSGCHILVSSVNFPATYPDQENRLTAHCKYIPPKQISRVEMNLKSIGKL